MRKMLVLSVAVLLVTCFVASKAAAQTQFGTVSGRLTDATGAVVPDAKVTITNLATNTKQETQSNSDGLYAIANVVAGNYEIAIEKQSFRRTTRRFTVAVAQRVDMDFTLQLGPVTETVTVSEAAAVINTTSGELSREITPKELSTLPLISRNPYALVGLTAGASDTGRVTGDTRGGVEALGENGGLAVNGARTSAVNFMLDGGENNDTFVAGVGQTVPLDAIQEFRVQSNSTTAEFGRNAIVANVITKSGTNNYHASAYEYYRGSALSTAVFDDKASGTPKSNFVRNLFGGSVGGPILKDKTFFFGSFEPTRIRSTGTQRFFVPVSGFTSNASANTNAFINAFGGPPPSNCADAAVPASDIWNRIEGNATRLQPPPNPLGATEAYGTGSIANPGNSFGLFPAGTALAADGSGPTASLIGGPTGATNLFCRTTLRAPIDAGGGTPQDAWLAEGRIDHHFGQNTALFGRYGFQKSDQQDGSTSLSPYQGFNTGRNIQNQNMNVTLTHSFSPTLFTEARGIYNRVRDFLPLGTAPATTPCWSYDLNKNTLTGDQITFPGYVPLVCSFAGIPFGGPQNTYQGYQGFTWVKGKHTVKWGGQYLHLRDNRTFGAYENAFFDTFTMQSMLNGAVDFIFAAIDPKGKVPGDTYCIAAPCPVGVNLDGPLGFPSFTRHFHYNEIAFYGGDSFKVTPQLTVTVGVRWEYFGVLHSPDNEKFLDANLYLNAVGSVPPIGTSKTIFEAVRDARFRRTSQLYRPDYRDFGPRVSVAYDIFGNGRSVFRAGYGIYYDRNFGNAVFNVIQNPPNYAVVALTPSPGLPINANQFTTLGSAGGSFGITSSARMLDNDLRTAYNQQWNATVEHDVLGKGIIASLSYVGSSGMRLYSLNNLNQRGSCLLLPGVTAANCSPAGGNSSRLNQTGLTGMNRRGNEGLSRYHGLSAQVRAPRVLNTGLSITGNYTWSHSIDNSSSFFADSPFEGNFGFGFRDEYNPARDRASSTNDFRHRGTISGTWEVPWGKGMTGIAGQVLGGWTLSGIFFAQTGGAFTVYDRSASQCRSSGTNFCFPLQIAPVPARTETPVAGSSNSFTLYSVGSTFQSQNAFCAANTLASPLGPLSGTACTSALVNLRSDLLSPRNLFRTPGIWNLDGAVLKDFRMPWKEGHRVQFRAEFFNVFNHSNLYVNVGTNQFSGSATQQVTGNRGISPGGGKERRNIQLALRYSF